jgi:hypothetical protein
MVLKAVDYGFIGLKLKDLIFQENRTDESREDEYSEFKETL